MVSMKNILLISFLMVSLLVFNFASAALYKGVDAEGKVIYSDTPFQDAEKFSPPPLSVVGAAKKKVEKTDKVEEKPAPFKYLSFDIVTPKSNETLRNEFNVAVTLKIKPRLNTAENHTITMMVNGKPVIKNSQNLSFKVGRLDRGANELQALIKNQSGKTVARTRTTVIFVHQTAVGR